MIPGSQLPSRLALCLLLCMLAPCIRAQQVEFNILKGKSVVGRIVALKNVNGPHVHYISTSYASVDLVINKTITTSAGARYHQGKLLNCHALVKVNGNMKDSSHMVVHDAAAQGYVHPGPARTFTDIGTWTTCRMYFEEPVDVDHVHVESVLQACPLVRTAPGRYTLTLPNGNVNRYIYRSGVLVEIHVDRTLVDLVFKRV